MANQALTRPSISLANTIRAAALAGLAFAAPPALAQDITEDGFTAFTLDQTGLSAEYEIDVQSRTQIRLSLDVSAEDPVTMVAQWNVIPASNFADRPFASDAHIAHFSPFCDRNMFGPCVFSPVTPAEWPRLQYRVVRERDATIALAAERWNGEVLYHITAFLPAGADEAAIAADLEEVVKQIDTFMGQDLVPFEEFVE